MVCHTTALKIVGLALVALIISGCQSEVQSSPNIQFSAPKRILQVRAIDRSQLRPVVELSNGLSIPMRPVGDNNWTGTINVQPNSTYSVSVAWIETLPEGPLELATWSSDVAVDADGTQINVNNESYNYTSDEDGDSVSNLQERQDGTDPFVHNGQSSNTDGGTTGSSTDAGNDNNTDPSTGDDTQGTDGNNNDPDDDDADENTGAQASDDDDDDDDTDHNALTSRASVLVPRITKSQAPKIDGFGAELNNQFNLKGEWANAVQYDDAGALLSIDRLMIDNGADAEDGTQLRRWAAMHDGETLYVLVLSDDIGARHSDSDQAWQDDNLELFIDGDNSKLSEWGDGDDFHYLIPLLKQGTNQANHEYDGRFRPGPGSSESALEFDFSTGPGQGPDGIRIKKWEQDVYELAISLDSAGIKTGEAFGFELQIDDDDDGGERNSKWGWYHPSRVNDTDTDTTYLIPSVMGTLMLEE